MKNGFSYQRAPVSMPGRHINDHQLRLYMKSRLLDSPSLSAARAAFSTATAYRIERKRSSKYVLPVLT
ncbi:MAG: hypothetical protein WDO56_05145 [Gammaproteobacteria bacterium]